MSFDFSFDPGTTEDLQREIDSISIKYERQEKQIERARKEAERYETQIERIGRTYRRAMGGSAGPGLRQEVHGFKDMTELFSGNLSSRNVRGALEFGGSLFGEGVVGGFLGDAATIAGGVGIAAVAARIAAEPVKEAFEKANSIGESHLQQTKAVEKLLGINREGASELVTNLRSHIRDKRLDGDMNERIEQGQEITQKLIEHIQKISEDPDIASAAITKYRMRNGRSGIPDKYLNEIMGTEVEHNKEAVSRAILDQAREKDMNFEWTCEFIEKEISGYHERSKPLQGTNLVRFQRRERMFNAMAEREKLSQMEWTSN
jgi:hypothetical protein